MEAKLLPQSRSPIGGCLISRRVRNKQRRSSIVGVLARPAPENIAAAITEKLMLKPVETKTETTSVYNDNWFELMAINYLSQTLQSATGS